MSKTADCPSCGDTLNLEDFIDGDLIQDAELECDICGEPLHLEVHTNGMGVSSYKLVSDDEEAEDDDL